MKTTREKADHLIEQCMSYIEEKYSEEIEYDNLNIDRKDLVHTAILSVKHTIEVLNSIYFKTAETAREIDYAIFEQTELLAELESRI